MPLKMLLGLALLAIGLSGCAIVNYREPQTAAFKKFAGRTAYRYDSDRSQPFALVYRADGGGYKYKYIVVGSHGRVRPVKADGALNRVISDLQTSFYDPDNSSDDNDD